MSTLDTKETLATLHRVNAIAKIRKLAVNEIFRAAREAGSLEILRAEIERIEQEMHNHEQHLVSQG